MSLPKNSLYAVLFLACLGGYSWLIFNLTFSGSFPAAETNLCLIKHVTGMPCPSCGSTRSVLSLLQGDLPSAWHWNPFGFVILGIMLLSPLWILYDVIAKKNTLFRMYILMESAFRNRSIYLPAIFIVLSNWLWNIHKGF